jgi:hypothetical protein
MDPMNQSKGKASPKTSKPQAARPNPSKPTTGQRKVTFDKRTHKRNVEPTDFAGSFNSMSQQFPRQRNTSRRQREEVIPFDELVSVINGSTGTGLTTTAYPIQPGAPGSYPWLSGEVNQKWSKWGSLDQEYYYKPQGSGFATPNTQGKVIFSIQYDPTMAPPTTLQEVEDTDDHNDCVPYQEMTLRSRNADMMDGLSFKKVRGSFLPTNGDVMDYDGGNLFVSTYNCANTNPIGELRVRGRVRVKNRITNQDAVGAPINNSVGLFQSATAGEALTTATPLQLLLAGTTATNGSVNGIGAVNTVGSIVPQPGNYLVDCSVTFDGSLNDGSVYFISLKKNTTVLGPVGSGFTAETVSVANTFAFNTLNWSGYVSCNGTDALTLSAQSTFSGGTCLAFGTLRLVGV